MTRMQCAMQCAMHRMQCAMHPCMQCAMHPPMRRIAPIYAHAYAMLWKAAMHRYAPFKPERTRPIRDAMPTSAACVWRAAWEHGSARARPVKRGRVGTQPRAARPPRAPMAREEEEPGSIEGLVHVRHSAAARLATPKPFRPAMAQASRAARAPSCAEPGERASMATTQGGEACP